MFAEFLRDKCSFSLPQGKGLDYYHQRVHVPDDFPNYLDLGS